jgi:predicted membrane channel-forming protein YqfA (hemolysin III family)
MGLLEYLLERKNPGNVGSIESNSEPINRVSIPLLVVKSIIALLLLGGLFYITAGDRIGVGNVIVYGIIMLLYCSISYHVIPKPDTSNVGLFGGLVDHPFKFTDDLNRFLIFLSILLYPGRFIATTFLQVIQLFKRN